MTTIIDPKSKLATQLKNCKVCDEPIYFGFTDKGKRNPYDVIDGEPTRVSHFGTCSQVERFRQLNPRTRV